MRTATSPTSAWRCCAGFTLMEMLVVLVVAALASAVVVPRLFSGGETVSARATGLSVGAALRKVRADAIKFNRDAVLRIDAENAILFTDDGSIDSGALDGFEIKLVIAESERTGEAKGGFRFFSDGSSTGGRITLSRKGEAEDADVVIGVDWLTGRVRIID